MLAQTTPCRPCQASLAAQHHAAPCCKATHLHLLNCPFPAVYARLPPPLQATASVASQPVSTTQSLDVVALGNLCVDIVLPVDSLPPVDIDYRRRLLTDLTNTPADTKTWEVGGNCNFMIAAARLGMKVASVGHVGSDIYGKFMEEVLTDERVVAVQRIAPDVHGSGLDQTLLCFVLVDPASKHAFCSRYDFGPWPLLEGISSLPATATQALRSSRAVFMNGFVFDELPLGVVRASCEDAIKHGSSVFFDPGPRCHTMLEGSRREAMDMVMDLSAVVLMTEEEAQTVTGFDDPEKSAHWVLNRPDARTQWCVVKLGGQGALLCSKQTGLARRYPGIKVEVQDTVGCGDSFASAIVLGYINKHSPSSTMMLANAVGAATAMGRGAGRNVANAETVMQLLQSTGAANDSAADALHILRSSLSSSVRLR